jgi:hypothetical protein
MFHIHNVMCPEFRNEFIDTIFYNLSYSQSIIALPLIYPLHKSQGHTIHFLETDLAQELSPQVTMKSACLFLFNHLGMLTLQNSTQFSNAQSQSHIATDGRALSQSVFVLAEQSRAVAYCRQPASMITPGIEPRWDPWPYICSMSRLCFFPLLSLFLF